MSVAVVAEKPSVARDLARVLGAEQRADGCLRGEGWIVTWAIGHLAALAEPHEIRPEWRAWRQTLLPMIPERWPLVVYERTRSQFEVVKRILRDPEVERVVCATDAGREGELIFRYVFEAARRDASPSSGSGSRRSPPTRSAPASRGCARSASSTAWPTPRAAAAAPTGWSA